MAKKKRPPISKANLDNAVEELEQLDIQIAAATKRRDKIRRTMADLFHDGETGTQNTEIHGYKITTVRRMSITCPAEEKEEFEDKNPKLFNIVFPKKVVRNMDSSAAKEHLDDIEDYVTTKQGLPTITIKRIE